MTSRLAVRSLIGLCTGLTFALAPPSVGAQGDLPPAPCTAWQVDYALSGSLQLTDTTLGQGDGTYAVGPGSMTLRFDDVDSKPGGRASLVAYEMHEGFKVFSRTLFWATTVTTNTISRAVGADPCGAPQALLTGTTLGWSLPVPGVRTDGTLFCEGSFCGKFGAPPPGQSEIHMPAHATTFKSFQFSADMQTFTMRSTLVSKTDTPMQTAHLALSGRELRRACMPAARPCP
jgi:hypothetical protein